MTEILDSVMRLASVQNDLVNKNTLLTAENQRLRKIINDTKGKSYISVVEENSRLLAEIRTLRIQVNRLENKPTNRKAGEEAFPWSSWPEVEAEATRMYLASEKETDIQIYVEKATGIMRPSGRPINARFTNGAPPDFLEAEVLKSGPTSWVELWKIGSTLSKKAWQLTLLQSIGAYSTISGGKKKLPRDLLKTDPNKILTEQQIRAARKLYWDKVI